MPQRRSSPSRPELGAEEALGLLATMWRIRLFEERVGQLKRADEVHGLIHLCVGQEGVAAGVCTSFATTTPSTAGTARTGTRWPRARRSSARWRS